MLFYFSSSVVIVFFSSCFVLVSISVYFCIIGSNKDYFELNFEGSVLGPILFAIYINDLPDALKNSSTTIMYADDTKVYWRTNTTNGQQLLQEDLDALYNWSEKWQLRFHPDKCKVLPLGNRPPESKPKLHLYTRDDNGTLREAPLEETISEKDIGVSVNNKLSFREQIDTKTTKANTAMGIIRRTFDHLDKHTFMLLYRSMVRPHLKVSNSIWIPHQKQDIETIEQVQKRATKYIPGFKDLPMNNAWDYWGYQHPHIEESAGIWSRPTKFWQESMMQKSFQTRLKVTKKLKAIARSYLRGEQQTSIAASNSLPLVSSAYGMACLIMLLMPQTSAASNDAWTNTGGITQASMITWKNPIATSVGANHTGIPNLHWRMRLAS